MDNVYECPHEVAEFSIRQLLPVLTTDQLERFAEDLAAELATRRQDADVQDDPVRCMECGCPLDDAFDSVCSPCNRWLRDNLNTSVRTPNPQLNPTRLEVLT